jgi:RND family efflux transporter MFP subunit
MTAETDPGAPDPRYQQGWIGWIQIAAILVVIIGAGLLTLSLMSGGSGPTGESAGRPNTPVRVITPEASSHTVVLTVTGTVTATAQVDLSPQVGGRIVEISPNARTGAAFEAGEVLFQIDPRDYRVAVTRARAALADAAAALQQTEADAEIARREWTAIYPDREISPLAAREPQLAAARARQLAAEADLAQAQLNLERTEVAFPFEGRVSESRVEAGLLVAAGQRYGAVYDISTLEIVAPIAPSDLARLGDVAQASVDVSLESGEVFTATIARVGAQLDARTRFIDLFLNPGDAVERLRPGQFAQIEIQGPSLDGVFVLPAEAAPSLDQVRIVEDGQIVERAITVLDRSRGAVIAARFDFGEGVIISPVPEGAIGRPADILSDGETGAVPR